MSMFVDFSMTINFGNIPGDARSAVKKCDHASTMVGVVGFPS